MTDPYFIRVLMTDPYMTRVLALTAFRIADLFSTWLVTPDLRLEANPFVSLMGWRVTMIANCVAIPLLAIAPSICLTVALLSLIATVVNLHNSCK